MSLLRDISSPRAFGRFAHPVSLAGVGVFSSDVLCHAARGAGMTTLLVISALGAYFAFVLAIAGLVGFNRLGDDE